MNSPPLSNILTERSPQYTRCQKIIHFFLYSHRCKELLISEFAKQATATLPLALLVIAGLVTVISVATVVPGTPILFLILITCMERSVSGITVAT